jgi:hypothetical protein
MHVEGVIKAFLIAVILSGISFQRNSRNARIADSTSSQPTQDQQLKLEIPKNSWEPIFFREIDKRAKLAKLLSLRSVLPNDDLEARLWTESGPFGLDGIVIARKKNVWSGTYIHGMSTDPNFKQYNEQLPQPGSGWDVAWKRMVDAGLLTLPDASQIGCFIGGGKDMPWFVFEINVNKTYRTYMYEYRVPAQCEEAKRMVKLVSIISDEFDLKWKLSTN